MEHARECAYRQLPFWQVCQIPEYYLMAYSNDVWPKLIPCTDPGMSACTCFGKIHFARLVGEDIARHGFDLFKSQRQLRGRRQGLWASCYTHKCDLKGQRVYRQGVSLWLRTRLDCRGNWWRTSCTWSTFYRWVWTCMSTTRCEPVWELQSVGILPLYHLIVSCFSLVSPVDHNPESFLHDHTGVTFIGRPFPLDEAHEHLARLRRWGLTFSTFLQSLHLTK
jgi:hypothetical protein